MSRRAKLMDLEPALATDGRLAFTCPACTPRRAEDEHIIIVHTRRNSTYQGTTHDMTNQYDKSGALDFGRITLTPDVMLSCCLSRGLPLKLWVTKGIVTW